MTSAELLCEPDAVDPYSGARPLQRKHSAALLDRVLQSCNGRVAVFDLDSTLLNNRPRSALIMREFASEFGIESLASARAEHWQDWSAATAMANIGLNKDSIETHIDRFDGYWRERFFTSEYCTHDEAVSGAVDFVKSVNSAGGSIVYLTGRPTQMQSGTVNCLERLGMPSPLPLQSSDDLPAIVPGQPTVSLVMKPQFDGSDDDFKQRQASILAEIKPDMEVVNANENQSPGAVAVAAVAVFDNEPQHINTYKSLMKGTECIHLFTDHSMRTIKLLSGIPSIRDFTR